MKTIVLFFLGISISSHSMANEKSMRSHVYIKTSPVLPLFLRAAEGGVGMTLGKQWSLGLTGAIGEGTETNPNNEDFDYTYQGLAIDTAYFTRSVHRDGLYLRLMAGLVHHEASADLTKLDESETTIDMIMIKPSLEAKFLLAINGSGMVDSIFTLVAA